MGAHGKPLQQLKIMGHSHKKEFFVHFIQQFIVIPGPETKPVPSAVESDRGDNGQIQFIKVGTICSVVGLQNSEGARPKMVKISKLR